MATHSSILAGKKIPQREEPGKATVSIESQSQTRLTELVPVHAHVHTHTHTGNPCGWELGFIERLFCVIRSNFHHPQ